MTSGPREIRNDTNVDTIRSGALARFLSAIEKIGNRLPAPFYLFVILALVVIVASAVLAQFGVQFQHPKDGSAMAIRSLASREGVAFLLGGTVKNFTGFAPLGLVVVIMFGIGLATKVGFFGAFMKRTILHAPRRLVTYAAMLAGVLGNLASSAAFIIVPPITAMVFRSMGRHPLAGLAVGFASVGAGFTANFMIAGTDVLIAGITTDAIGSLREGMVVNPYDNWYFMCASVVLLVLVGGWITERIVEPRLGRYEGDTDSGAKAAGNKATGNNASGGNTVPDEMTAQLSPLERKGLRNGYIAGGVFIALVVLAALPEASFLRAADGSFDKAPLLKGVVTLLFLLFVTVAVAYGKTAGTITRAADVPRLMAEAMRDLASFFVLIFAVSQFVAYFKWAHLDVWIAVSGAEFLKSMNLTGLPVVVAFIVFAALLNLFITSGSAQWSLMAPIFIPMFILLDYHPAFTQLAFRMADSSTNIITPLSPWLPVILEYMRQYDRRTGIGTIVSLMLPYSILFLLSWVVLFIVWNMLGIPIGPGVTMYLPAGG